MTTTSVNPTTGATENTKHVQVINAKDELKVRILAHNKCNFAQAEGTPFRQLPLKHIHADNVLTSYFDDNGQPIGLPDSTFAETASVL
jgi:hypothetical protein